MSKAEESRHFRAYLNNQLLFKFVVIAILVHENFWSHLIFLLITEELILTMLSQAFPSLPTVMSTQSRHTSQIHKFRHITSLKILPVSYLLGGQKRNCMDSLSQVQEGLKDEI